MSVNRNLKALQHCKDAISVHSVWNSIGDTTSMQRPRGQTLATRWPLAGHSLATRWPHAGHLGFTVFSVLSTRRENNDYSNIIKQLLVRSPFSFRSVNSKWPACGQRVASEWPTSGQRSGSVGLASRVLNVWRNGSTPPHTPRRDRPARGAPHDVRQHASPRRLAKPLQQALAEWLVGSRL